MEGPTIFQLMPRCWIVESETVDVETPVIGETMVGVLGVVIGGVGEVPPGTGTPITTATCPSEPPATAAVGPGTVETHATETIDEFGEVLQLDFVADGVVGSFFDNVPASARVAPPITPPMAIHFSFDRDAFCGEGGAFCPIATVGNKTIKASVIGILMNGTSLR